MSCPGIFHAVRARFFLRARSDVEDGHMSIAARIHEQSTHVRLPHLTMIRVHVHWKKIAANHKKIKD